MLGIAQGRIRSEVDHREWNERDLHIGGIDAYRGCGDHHGVDPEFTMTSMLCVVSFVLQT